MKDSLRNDIIEKLTQIPIEDIFERLPKDIVFIERELGSIYSAADKLNKISL